MKEDGGKKSTHCMIPFIESSRKCKRISSDRKQSSGCLGMGDGGNGCLPKRPKETLGTNGNVHCLDCDDGFMGMSVCQNSSNCTL